MTSERDELVMRQLLQLAYDFSYIPTTTCAADPHLVSLLPELNELTIASLDHWFATEGKNYSVEHQLRTTLRFCQTLGVGASWFYYQQDAPMDAQALFQLMATPRGTYAMDEYVEDVVGIWFSSDSDKHSQWLSLCDYYHDVALQHYDWSTTKDKHEACLTVMYGGMVIGIGILSQERSKVNYEGDFAWGTDTWSSIINNRKHTVSGTLDNWVKMCLKKGIPTGGNFVSLPKSPDSFEHQVNCYHQFGFFANSGVQTTFRIDEGIPSMVTIMPYIDSMRTHYLIVDKVHERSNGVEATITAHFANDPLTQVTFYDTEYLKNREQYFAGQCYVFDLYGVAYQMSVIPQSVHQPLHSFVQIGSLHPEVCRFRAPIHDIYGETDIVTSSLFEVEVGIPMRNLRDRQKHDISIFIPMKQLAGRESSLDRGTSIEGTCIMMGKMRVQVNFEERPSTTVHSFDLLTKTGRPSRFTHKCKPSEVGIEMNAAERYAFAKKVVKQYLKPDLEWLTEDDDDSDFMLSRHRNLWVKPDDTYTATEQFTTEDITPGLTHYYQTGRFPIMAYVTLYDQQGQRCAWLKGGSYTARMHYGSMLPGQRIAPREAYQDAMLAHALLDALCNFHTFPLCKLLHKDLLFTSYNLLDPVITREEFLVHLQEVFNARVLEAESEISAKLCYDAAQEAYIELTYPGGVVDRMDFKTCNNLITEIHISNLRRGKK